jgi:ankyrin repeat protein
MKSGLIAAIVGAFVAPMLSAETVCDLFQNLTAAGGHHLTLSGDLLLSREFAALGSPDCDNPYVSDHVIQPSAVRLILSASAPVEQTRQFQLAIEKAEKLRREGRRIDASGVFSGRLSVGMVGDFPAQFSIDSIDSMKVEAFPDASELPVIAICDLFKSLESYRGQRIAVRAELVGTSEGSWLVGGCQGAFSTDGYRWPVALGYGEPSYYSSQTQHLVEPKRPKEQPKGHELYKARFSVVRTATYVGRLRMQDHYRAFCQPDGHFVANGFGHLNGAVGELVVEEVRDEEIAPQKPSEITAHEEEQPCEQLNHEMQCVGAGALAQAVTLGCFARAKELLAKDGIDSTGASESAALAAAIRRGNSELVELLLAAGAPVNPVDVSLWPPLEEAAHTQKTDVMKVLVRAGADVNAVDHNGATYLANYGCFFPAVTKILLDAGADPDARDRRGQTALMQASGYGFEEVIKLLIQHRADVNLKDDKGRTPLMHAAAGKFVDAIPLLLAASADVQAHDQNGDTALDIARKAQNEVAVELLTSAVKDPR